MKDIVIYGAGGFGKEVFCLLKSINKVHNTWNIIGFIDDGLPEGKANEYGIILGNIDYLNSISKPVDVVMAIGNPKTQLNIINRINNSNIEFPNIIAPDTLIYDIGMLKMGKGNLIGFRSVISCYVEIGDFNLMNCDVFIGHESKIGNFNMFNPSVRISGQVNIGDLNYFGVCSVVLQQKKVGNRTTISANSVVIRNTENNCLYIGNPAIKMTF